jgi:hypothetical protein
MHIHDGRVYIGTNKGHVFVYDISTGSPQYIQSLSMMSYPVYEITTTCADELVVAFDSMVSVYKVSTEKDSLEKLYHFQVTGGHQVHACLAIPKTEYICIGLSDGSVALYHKGRAVYARYFSEVRINVLHYSQADGVLWVGTDDGRIAECIIPSTLVDDIKYVEDCNALSVSLEKPQQPLRATAVSDAPLLVSQSAVTVKTAPNIKSAALAENDSDDEDWKRGLFAT